MASQAIEKRRLRKKRELSKRPAPYRIPNPTILIVCEGKNTETSYFEQFRVKSLTIEPVGTGESTISLVKHAEALNERKKYKQVWCVFDKDLFPNDNFNEAINRAKRNGYGVAYSNQAFEYWLILHFNDHQGAGLHRSNYDTTINSYINPLGVEYDGNGCKIISEDFSILCYHLMLFRANFKMLIDAYRCL